MIGPRPLISEKIGNPSVYSPLKATARPVASPPCSESSPEKRMAIEKGKNKEKKTT
ncbi:hypothetical protein ACN6KK_00120 [Enterococcus faecium]